MASSYAKRAFVAASAAFVMVALAAMSLGGPYSTVASNMLALEHSRAAGSDAEEFPEATVDVKSFNEAVSEATSKIKSFSV
jgi:hypothetical protein